MNLVGIVIYVIVNLLLFQHISLIIVLKDVLLIYVILVSGDIEQQELKQLLCFYMLQLHIHEMLVRDRKRHV